MIGDLFDSPWKILIVAVVIIVLFGSRKLPDAARSLGRSMRILKTEVQGMHDDEPAQGAPGPFTQPELGAAPQQEQAAAPAPDAPPYVTPGKRVAKGDILCVIEAMKTLNEIESERDGVVSRILVQNGEMVEYGQALFELEEG